MLMALGQPARLFLARCSRHCLPRLHLRILTPGRGGGEKETEEDEETREEEEKKTKHSPRDTAPQISSGFGSSYEL